jgi:hypothetical protein
MGVGRATAFVLPVDAILGDPNGWGVEIDEVVKKIQKKKFKKGCSSCVGGGGDKERISSFLPALLACLVARSQ